jgi:hypothetical protein
MTCFVRVGLYGLYFRVISPWFCMAVKCGILRESENVNCVRRQDAQKDVSVKCVSRLGTGEWRRLHNEELYDLYCLADIIRVIKSRSMRWAGHVARMGDRRGAYRVLMGRPDGKRSRGIPGRRWGDNIKINIQDVEWGGVDWIAVAQDRDRWWALVNAVMNLRVS